MHSNAGHLQIQNLCYLIFSSIHVQTLGVCVPDDVECTLLKMKLEDYRNSVLHGAAGSDLMRLRRVQNSLALQPELAHLRMPHPCFKSFTAFQSHVD